MFIHTVHINYIAEFIIKYLLGYFEYHLNAISLELISDSDSGDYEDDCLMRLSSERSLVFSMIIYTRLQWEIFQTQSSSRLELIIKPSSNTIEYNKYLIHFSRLFKHCFHCVFWKPVHKQHFISH